MRILVSVLLINISIIIFAQTENSNDYESKTITVLNNGAVLYELPTIQSNVICEIPFWEIVFLYSRDYIPEHDTINGIPGYWAKAKYENNFGYIFTGVIDNYTNESDFKYRILQESGAVNDLNYEPNLHWYGIYKTKYSEVDSLVKVDIHFERTRSDIDGSAITVVRTNLSSRIKSEFLIGSKENLKEKIIYNYLIQRTGKNKYLVLYPGIEYSNFQVTGCVSEYEYGSPIISDYKISINQNDIVQDFKSKDAISWASILYAGHINNDNFDDYIIFELYSYNSGVIHLFLSNDSNILSKVSELKVYDDD